MVGCLLQLNTKLCAYTDPSVCKKANYISGTLCMNPDISCYLTQPQSLPTQSIQAIIMKMIQFFEASSPFLLPPAKRGIVKQQSCSSMAHILLRKIQHPTLLRSTSSVWRVTEGIFMVHYLPAAIVRGLRCTCVIQNTIHRENLLKLAISFLITPANNIGCERHPLLRKGYLWHSWKNSHTGSSLAGRFCWWLSGTNFHPLATHAEVERSHGPKPCRLCCQWKLWASEKKKRHW